MRFWKFQILEKCPGPIFKNQQKNGVWKHPALPGSKIPPLAIHKSISHVWEDRSRKVNNDEPDLRFFYGNFWPVISRTVRKPCFSTSIPRGQNLAIRAGLSWWGTLWTAEGTDCCGLERQGHTVDCWMHRLLCGPERPTWPQPGGPFIYRWNVRRAANVDLHPKRQDEVVAGSFF